MKLENLKGKKFNKLQVIERVIKENNKQTYWKCICECGDTTIVTSAHLKNGHTKSCGCLQKEVVKNMMTTHNLTHTKLFKVWRGIIDRTLYPSNKKYKNYGGRGITICCEWLNDFKVFYDWAINNGYKEGLTIDRIDVNGNYEPNNCRWVNWKTQQNNRRNNHYITYNNETHTMKEWSELLGINYATLSMRINKYKWSIERSFGFVS